MCSITSSRDEQTDEREAGAGHWVVGQIDANPNSASDTPTQE